MVADNAIKAENAKMVGEAATKVGGAAWDSEYGDSVKKDVINWWDRQGDTDTGYNPENTNPDTSFIGHR
jgi:hypothetical protein